MDTECNLHPLFPSLSVSFLRSRTLTHCFSIHLTLTHSLSFTLACSRWYSTQLSSLSLPCPPSPQFFGPIRSHESCACNLENEGTKKKFLFGDKISICDVSLALNVTIVKTFDNFDIGSLYPLVRQHQLRVIAECEFWEKVAFSILFFFPFQ